MSKTPSPHLLQGSFAPRSDKNLDEGRRDFAIPIKLRGQGDTDTFEVVVPDVSGELWKSAVETLELSSEWMDQLNQSVGASFSFAFSLTKTLPLWTG